MKFPLKAAKLAGVLALALGAAAPAFITPAAAEPYHDSYHRDRDHGHDRNRDGNRDGYHGDRDGGRHFDRDGHRGHWGWRNNHREWIWFGR